MSKPADQPHFLIRKFQNYQRQAARQYICHLCNGNVAFIAENKLRDHISSFHRDPPLDDRARAKSLNQSNKPRRGEVGKALREPNTKISSSGSFDSMQAQLEDKTSQNRPISAPGAAETTDSFNDLSIAAEPSSPPQVASIDPPSEGLDQPFDTRVRATSQKARPQSGDACRPKPSGPPQPSSGRRALVNPDEDPAYHGNNGQGLTSHSKPRPTQTSPDPPDKLPPDTRENVGTLSSLKPSSHSEQDSDAETEPELLLQPETRPISHEQLVVEVKGIYAGLVMVEAKCIDVDEKQSLAAQEGDVSKRTNLTSEQWSALIALHKTLLHEHHDFFLASQHPAASPALSKLAAKYSMPARMWRHGIHAFLEVLRYRLPESLDHMLAFIYISYSMMALLYETVDAFQDTWIECLGDLGRYRMAIEDDDIGDREVWSGVAKFWYAKAADKNPKVGRLYHHLAILARPFTIQQLCLYCKSLSCQAPFESARTSIMTMLTPVLQGRESVYHRSSTMEIVFIHAHAILFIIVYKVLPADQSIQKYKDLVDQLISRELFSKFINRAGLKFKEIGVWTALTNISALHLYGATNEKGTFKSLLRLRYEESVQFKAQQLPGEDEEARATSARPLQRVEYLPTNDQESSLGATSNASLIALSTFAISLRRPRDKNVFPMIHVMAVFIWAYAWVDKAMLLIERSIPWRDIVSFLNTIIPKNGLGARTKSPSFPGRPNGNKARPLPEDYSMRGFPWTESYFPSGWFDDTGIDDEERVLELPSFHDPRKDRIIWAFYQVATLRKWICFDEQRCTFVETDYVRRLQEWDPSIAMEPVAEQPDIIMSGTTEGQVAGTTSELVEQREQTKESIVKRPEATPPMISPLTQTPKKILKRESSTSYSEDPETRNRIRIKQERLSPPPTIKNTRTVTDEWLNPIEQPQRSSIKHDIAMEGDPDQFKLPVVLDETKDPTKI